ncbi:MAG: membrane-bound lytic murein transglycosylase MltF [Cellvibrio sp.]|nr:membrane-bound lytic murein transglycosylase MltF [Cellvibrio sp.]
MDIRNLSNLVIRHLLLLTCLALSAILVERSVPQSHLERVIESGEIRVISRNGPTTYYEGSNGLTGYGYKLVKGFASQLGVKLVIVNEPQAPLLRLLNGQEDMVVAAITTNEAGDLPVRFADPHRQIQFELISHVDLPVPTDLASLEGLRVELTPEMAQHPEMQSIQAANPQVIWHLADTNDQADLLSRVHRGQLELAVVDSDTLLLHQYSFVNAQPAFTLGKPMDLAWAFAASVDVSLYQAAQSYMQQIKQSGRLERITAEFFQPNEEMTSVDALLLSQHLEQRLTPHMDDMKRASEEFNLDWRLLAAIGYKESQWLTKIESPTGVKGMMMLTKITAKAMGVQDREDPRQAIFGAAKLFRYLLDNQPEAIQGEDRVHFALASYNQGMGHIEDARRLTQRTGGDPNRWHDVRERLPLLSMRQYYSQARHGYMRGKEPVAFVDKVWDYYKMLVWHEQQENLRLATASGNPAWL